MLHADELASVGVGRGGGAAPGIAGGQGGRRPAGTSRPHHILLQLPRCVPVKQVAFGRPVRQLRDLRALGGTSRSGIWRAIIVERS